MILHFLYYTMFYYSYIIFYYTCFIALNPKPWYRKPRRRSCAAEASRPKADVPPRRHLEMCRLAVSIYPKAP